MGTANLQIATWGNLSNAGHTIPSGKTTTKCVTYNDLKSVSTVVPFTYSHYRVPGSLDTSALTIEMPLIKNGVGFNKQGQFTNMVEQVIYSFKPPIWEKSKVKFPLTSIELEHWELGTNACSVTLNIKVYLINNKDTSLTKIKTTTKSIICKHDANQSVHKTESIIIDWDDLEINFSNYPNDSEFEVLLDLSRTNPSNDNLMQYKFTYNYSQDCMNYYTSSKCVAYNLIKKV